MGGDTATFAELAQTRVLTFGDGYRTRADELGSSGYPILRVAQVADGRIRGESVVDHVRSEFGPRIGDKASREGDIVLTTKGTFGRRAIVDAAAVGYVYSPQVCYFRILDQDKLDPAYLYYWLGSTDFLHQAAARKSQTDMADYLSLRDLNTICIRLYSIEVQRATAQILSTLDDKIELNRRMSETLEAMARALFKSWFVDFDPVRAKSKGCDSGLPKSLADCFPDRLVDSELGEIPEGWKVDEVREHMVNFDSKRVPLSGAVRAQRQGPYPYHGAAGVMDYVDDYLFDGTYLLVGEDGSVVRESGIAVTQYVWDKFWVNNHAHVLKGAGAVSTEQLYLYFSFEPVAPFVTGAVQPKLSQGRLNSMPFVFAGRSICLAFEELVKPWFAKIRAGTEEARRLAALRDAILPKLMSGDLRAKDVPCSIEAASG